VRVQTTWMLPGALVLVTGMLGCGSEPEPAVNGSRTNVDESSPEHQPAVEKEAATQKRADERKAKTLQEDGPGLRTIIVFSRKKDESIIINDKEIVVRVVQIRSDEVWLRIEAFKDVTVNRRKPGLSS